MKWTSHLNSTNGSCNITNSYRISNANHGESRHLNLGGRRLHELDESFKDHELILCTQDEPHIGAQSHRILMNLMSPNSTNFTSHLNITNSSGVSNANDLCGVSVCLSVCLSVYLSVYLSVCRCIGVHQYLLSRHMRCAQVSLINRCAQVSLVKAHASKIRKCQIKKSPEKSQLSHVRPRALSYTEHPFQLKGRVMQCVLQCVLQCVAVSYICISEHIVDVWKHIVSTYIVTHSKWRCVTYIVCEAT